MEVRGWYLRPDFLPDMRSRKVFIIIIVFRETLFVISTSTYMFSVIVDSYLASYINISSINVRLSLIYDSDDFYVEKDMEDMEIDQIVDVPDTPDRLNTRHGGRKYVCDPDNSNSGEMNSCIAPQKPRPLFAHLGLKDNATENKKEHKTSTGNSPIPCIPDSSSASSNTFVGKCKIESKTLPCSNISVDRGKSIDQSSNSQEKTEKQTSLPPHLLAAPRVRGQKRLVRNGCISPHNIAARAKQSAEQNIQRTNDVEQRHPGDALFLISSKDIDTLYLVVALFSNLTWVLYLFILGSKGFGCFCTRDAGLSLCTPMVNDEDANGTSNAIRSSLESFGGSGGWRTTRNRRNMDQPLHDVTGHHSRRGNDSESFIGTQYRNRVDRRNIGSSQSSKDVPYPLENLASHATSLIIPDAEHSVLDTEIVELFPETTYTNRVSNNLDDMNNDDSDARARQVEADERLARELQDQLYHEEYFGGGEQIDEHFAWELQHEEDLLHTSIENHHISHPRWLSREPSNRQLRSRSHRSPTNRRRAGPNVSLSNRASQVRSRILNRSSTAAPMRGRPTTARGSRIRFPVEMDFDMRLDILEALEEAVGDISDMGVSDDIFHAHRDFNENDYEMLLALDENNHQHAGASNNQINSLPQSIIQTDNFQEVCAICLEIPVMGETIRHLPCLHKFHKDCIDPWLHRRTSCPVCKSSIA
ncbi:E3 ubiquitin-protein ligase SDIR1 [Senna tora]|uniref:E3 ubiquitin-protein ligase SDIR1 n=1 Tax=Senna tora TaxID=362788 RepID=A0A835CC80_9FABA|nr:E3 ubiquitin-protein ligase SDIR1 [Senna tora]